MELHSIKKNTKYFELKIILDKKNNKISVTSEMHV